MSADAMGALDPTVRSRLEARSRWHFSDLSGYALPELPSIPGMVSTSETRYYHWLTSQAYCGTGAVVEVGTWLGRSTVHLAAGLREAGYDDALHCYDRFVWDAGHSVKSGIRLKSGASFQPVFEEYVRPVYPKVRVHAGDLKDCTWEGGPIELLVLDAPKRLPELSAALACFGPHLLPETGLIVFQDYLHFPSYPIAVVASCLRPALEILHGVEDSCAASFRVTEPLRCDVAQATEWNYLRWDVAQARERWDEILAQLPERAWQRLAPGLAMWVYDLGYEDEAVAIARETCHGTEGLAGWEKLADTSLVQRYAPLFGALGVQPVRGGALDRKERERRRRRRRRLWEQRVQRARGILWRAVRRTLRMRSRRKAGSRG